MTIVERNQHIVKMKLSTIKLNHIFFQTKT